MLSSSSRLTPEPIDPQIDSIQPGGGVCMRLELVWGSLRRALLKACFPGYIRRMESLRQGDFNPCPFEVLDPRDLKFYRNQGGYSWKPEDDPFIWRDRLPFARAGLTELWILSSLFLLTGGVLGWWAASVSGVFQGLLLLATAAAAFCGLAIVWFFRNPRRIAPTDPGSVVSPADGTVVHIEELAFDEFVGGPALMIGIFLSVFNVHINRVPVDARIIGLQYRRGKFLNALRAASARENEQLAVRLEQNSAPYRRMVVRQIAGAIARRIVCWVYPGEELPIGAQFGMIKLGSRTEIIVPREAGLEIVAKMGQKVKAGESILLRYR